MLGALLGSVAGGFGRNKQKDKQGAAAMIDDLENEANVQVEHDAMARQAGAREYELENMARHRAGELNSAELGLANMKQAMNDPSAMKEMAEMMRDPEAQQKVKEMMADPTFQAQAQAALKGMMGGAGGAGGMPDIAKMMQDPNIMAKARQMASAMYGSGAGAAGAGGEAAEMLRLRAENARLKAAMGA